jgi:hypothetical protein
MQTVPHLPQFIGFVCVSTHSPLQTVSPLLPFGHLQLPPLHVVGAPQTLLQAPQFIESVLVSTQVSMHSVCVTPLASGHTHLPASQLVRVGHAMSQAPQRSALVMVSTQASSQHVPWHGLPAHITVAPTDMPPAPALAVGVMPPPPALVPAPLPAVGVTLLPGVAVPFAPCAQPMAASAHTTATAHPLTALRPIQHLD